MCELWRLHCRPLIAQPRYFGRGCEVLPACCPPEAAARRHIRLNRCPHSTTACSKLAPALMAGNSVVLKPPTQVRAVVACLT